MADKIYIPDENEEFDVIKPYVPESDEEFEVVTPSQDTKMPDKSYWDKIVDAVTTPYPQDYEAFERKHIIEPESIKQSAIGAGLGAAENMTFGQLPNIVQAVSGEDARQKFLDYEEEAFENAPVASVIGGLASPNPAGKLMQLQKVYKGLQSLKGLSGAEKAANLGQKIRSGAIDLGTGIGVGMTGAGSYGMSHSRDADLVDRVKTGADFAIDPLVLGLSAGLPIAGMTTMKGGDLISKIGGRLGIKSRKLAKEGYDFGLKAKDYKNMTPDELNNVRMSNFDKDVKAGYEDTINEAQKLLKAPMEKREKLLSQYDDVKTQYDTFLIEARNKVMSLPDNDPNKNAMLKQLDEYVNRLDTIQEKIKIPVITKGTQEQDFLKQMSEKKRLEEIKDKLVASRSTEKIGEKEALIRASGKEDFKTGAPETYIDKDTGKQVLRKEVISGENKEIARLENIKRKLSESLNKTEIKAKHILEQDELSKSQAKSQDQINKIQLSTQQKLEKLNLERQGLMTKMSQLEGQDVAAPESQYLTDLIKLKQPGQLEVQTDAISGKKYVTYPKNATGEVEVQWLPENVDTTKMVEKTLETPAVHPKTELTPRELLQLKQDAGKFANRPGEQGEAGDIEYWLRKQVDERLDKVDSKFGELSKEYSETAKPYEQLLGFNPAHKIQPEEVTKQLNDFLALMEKINTPTSGVGEKVALRESLKRGEQVFRPLSQVNQDAANKITQRAQDISDKAEIARRLGYQISTASPSPETQILARLGGEYAIKGQELAGKTQKLANDLVNDPAFYARFLGHVMKKSAAFGEQMAKSANTHQGRTNALFSLMQQPGFRKMIEEIDIDNEAMKMENDNEPR